MICKKEYCTGCGLCASICPFKAIEMSRDDEGFYVPQVLEAICRKCDCCSMSCPQNKNLDNANVPIMSYAAYSNSEKIRMKSSSGGIFYELAKYTIDMGGYVCGAAYDDRLYVEHKIINDEELLGKLMLSKYMQSRMGDIYKQIESALQQGKKVLFCGTPCQVDAIKSYLKEMNIKRGGDILTVDLFCFGVLSPDVVAKYIKEMEEKYGKRVIDINYKDKTDGWHHQRIRLTFFDGTTELLDRNDADIFCKFFLEKKWAVRKSCFDCKYKTVGRVGDITIGDFWGIDDPEMDDNMGTSAIFINTCRGENLYKKLIKTRLKSKIKEVESIIKGNPYVFHNRFDDDFESREEFWRCMKQGIALNDILL